MHECKASRQCLLVVGQLSNWVAMQCQLLQVCELSKLLHLNQLGNLVGMQIQHLQLGKPGQLLLDIGQLAL